MDDVTDHGMQTRVFGTGPRRGALPQSVLRAARAGGPARPRRDAVGHRGPVLQSRRRADARRQGLSRSAPTPWRWTSAASSSICRVDPAGRVLGGSIPASRSWRTGSPGARGSGRRAPYDPAAPLHPPPPPPGGARGDVERHQRAQRIPQPVAHRNPHPVAHQHPERDRERRSPRAPARRAPATPRRATRAAARRAAPARTAARARA